MGFEQIRLRRRRLEPVVATQKPDFGAPTILSADPWDFVALWLRRKNQEEAFFYWEQARQFHLASRNMNPVSVPLTYYYSFLNSIKALLIVRGRKFAEHHGLSGNRCNTGRTALRNEIVEIKAKGVCGALATYCCDPPGPTTISLDKILMSIPSIHRAYTLSFTSAQEAFIPLLNPRFVKKSNSTQAWFAADLSGKFRRNDVKRALSSDFELDEGVTDKIVVRRKQRFTWETGNSSTNGNEDRFRTYHARTRKSVVPIIGSPTTWYLRKDLACLKGLERSQLTLMFAAMHRLGDLARYNPLALKRHLECQHNWLLSEYLRVAPAQFISHVASEITGQQFAVPYAAQY